MSTGEPSFTAQCGDCKQTARLPDEAAEMLTALREFLDGHRACSFEVVLRLSPSQGRPPTIDLTTSAEAATAG